MGKAFVTWLMIAGAFAAPAVGPREAVQSAVLRVTAVLENGAPDRSDASLRRRLERRQAEIRRIAGELFDFHEVSRRALSRHWAGRTPAEQTEFVALFTELLERAYIGKIETFSGERIVYVGESIDSDYAIVRSRVVTKGRAETALDYRLHVADGRWKVYDVLIDGVSFVATYRSQFNRIMQLSSFAGLLDQLRRKQIDGTVAERAGRKL